MDMCYATMMDHGIYGQYHNSIAFLNQGYAKKKKNVSG